MFSMAEHRKQFGRVMMMRKWMMNVDDFALHITRAKFTVWEKCDIKCRKWHDAEIFHFSVSVFHNTT